MADRMEPGRYYRVHRGPYRDLVVVLAAAEAAATSDRPVMVHEARPGSGHEFYVRPYDVEPWDEGPPGVRELRRPAPDPPDLRAAATEPRS